MNQLIREAKVEDIQVIYELIVELAIYEKEPDAVVASAEHIQENLFGANPVAYCHVAEVDGQVVGIAIWFLNYSTWQGKHGIYLEDLYIRPEFRGRGFGKALLKHLAALCNERGYGRFQWWVLDWNESAIEFYRGLGAEAMDEWTVYRVSGKGLEELGR